MYNHRDDPINETTAPIVDELDINWPLLPPSIPI